MQFSIFGSLVELGRADDGDGLRQHHLVGAVCVEVDTGQEGRLCGVSLQHTEYIRSTVTQLSCSNSSHQLLFYFCGMQSTKQ